MSNEAVFPTPEVPLVGSTPPDAIAALLERLQDADSLAGALVRWGLLATLPRERERVYLLGNVEFERAAVSGAHRIRQERYAIRGIVEVHDLDTSGPDQASGRAWQLLEGIDATLREDPDLLYARYDGSMRVLIDEALPASDGWIARLGFRLGFFHYVPETASPPQVQPPASGFDAADYGTVVGWYKPESLSAYADGAAISQWTDSGPSANHLTQASAPAQPVAKKSIINEKDVARFGGAASLQVSAPPTWSQPNVVFAVCKYTATGSNQIILTSGSSPTENALYVTSDGTFNVWGGSNLSSGVVRSGAFHVFEVIFNGASSSIVIDGTTAITGDIGAQNPVGLRVGVGFGSEFLNGDIAELIVYDDLVGPTNRAAVRAALASKYAIPVA